jgi:protein phosphatase
MKLLSFGGTDTGRTRPQNEDAFLVHDAVGLYAVADGIGGHEGGEIASRTAIDTLREVVPDMLGDKGRTPPAGFMDQAGQELSALRYALFLANRRIRDSEKRGPTLARMGTTLTVLLCANGFAFLAHIGDSRAYRMRGKKLEQLTQDHSVVAEQVRAGTLRPEQARISSYRHVITRALGIEDTFAPEVATLPLLRNDVFLLCTDGLTEMVSDSEIESILSVSDPRTAVGALIDSANKAGGADNITAVIVVVGEV